MVQVAEVQSPLASIRLDLSAYNLSWVCCRGGFRLVVANSACCATDRHRHVDEVEVERSLRLERIRCPRRFSSDDVIRVLLPVLSRDMAVHHGMRERWLRVFTICGEKVRRNVGYFDVQREEWKTWQTSEKKQPDDRCRCVPDSSILSLAYRFLCIVLQRVQASRSQNSG